MRVCYVASHAHGFDGWGRYTVEVVRGVRTRGIDPVLVTSDPTLDPALEGVEHHVLLPPLFTRRFETPRSLVAVPRLRRVLTTCDLVHCTVELYAPLVALATPAGVPYVQNAHGTWAIRPLLHRGQRALFAPALRRVDRLLVLSRFTRDRMARLIRLPPHEVLTGGVHPAAFEREVAVDLPPWAQEGPLVLSVGGVKARKGFHVALEAAALARRERPGLHYVVIGDVEGKPAYAARLRERAGELEMSESFHLLGRVPFDELVAWYQAADVFMLLPVNAGASVEGLGLVYLEAAAAGVPAVGTLDCGAEEAIVDGQTGYLVPQGDAAAAAEALLRLLRDGALRERMGQAARRRAQQLSWDALAERLVALYRELLNQQREVQVG